MMACPWARANVGSAVDGADHETAARRNPHNTRTEAAMIAIPTVMKPTVTTASCQGRAPWPPVIGERLAAPNIAASVVTAQLTYVPYNALQYAPAFSGAKSLTSAQIAPNATRKIPFMTPSRCAASPIRGLLKCCSTSPVSKPNRNRNIPCHINRRLLSSTPIIVPLDFSYFLGGWSDGPKIQSSDPINLVCRLLEWAAATAKRKTNICGYGSRLALA